jgi:predicted phosphodiesterase
MHEPISRVGAIGDIHAEDECLTTAIEFLGSRGLDLVVCIGDIADGKGCVNRCCELLEKHRIPTVRGNHDRWLLEGTNRGVEDASLLEQVGTGPRNYLASLPATLEYSTVNGGLLVCHGLGEYDLASVRPIDTADEIYDNLELWSLYRRTDLRFVINGHTHRREVRRFHHLIVIGVGTLHRDNTPCCAVIDIPSAVVEFYDIHCGTVTLAGASPGPASSEGIAADQYSSASPESLDT